MTGTIKHQFSFETGKLTPSGYDFTLATNHFCFWTNQSKIENQTTKTTTTETRNTTTNQVIELKHGKASREREKE